MASVSKGFSLPVLQRALELGTSTVQSIFNKKVLDVATSIIVATGASLMIVGVALASIGVTNNVVFNL